MRVVIIGLPALLGLAGCAISSGIRAVGPGTYAVSEMRAPVRGGGEEARRVVLAETDAFCRQQGRVFVPLDMRPDGDIRSPYFPTAFDALFRCVPPGEAAASVASQAPPQTAP
jgi:hypothetical protein